MAIDSSGELRDQLEVLFRASSDLLFRIRADGTLVEYRAGDAAVLFAPPEDFLGEKVQEVLPKEAGAQIFEGIQQVLGTDEVARIEYTLPNATGEKHFEARIVWLQDDEVLGVVREITELRKAERSLKESESLYRAVVESASSFIWVVDREGHFTFVNHRATQRILGWKAEEMVGRPFWEFMTQEQAEIDLQTFAALAERETWYDYETALLHKDGHLVPMLFNLVTRRDEEGNFAGATGTALDLTKARAAEEERRQFAERVRESQHFESLGVLAGGVAHDFNNLLVGILGGAELAMMGLEDTAPSRRHLNTITKAATRLSELSRQMLAYAGKGRFLMVPLDMSVVVNGIADLLRSSISKRASLQVQLSEGLPAVEADPTQLRQVIMNLITNASDAVHEGGGEIHLSTGIEERDEEELAALSLGAGLEAGRYVFVEVRDTGVGMDDITRRKIFDPFFTTKFTGRGLGLAAALGIVQGHRGCIAVESEPNAGTTFRIYLPATDKIARRTLERRSDVLGWSTRSTVLLADDEPTVRSIARELLEHASFEVVEAADGAEAVELFEASPERFDLLLLDVTMPRLGGPAALKAIRAHRAIPALLTSGYSEADVAELLSSEEKVGFVQKPFRAAALLEAVRDLLRK